MLSMMKCLVLHGKNSSPEKIRWLTEPISKFASVTAPSVDLEVAEIVEKFRDDAYECVAGHSRGGTAALLLGSLGARLVVAVSAPTDRRMQLEYLSAFAPGSIQHSLYMELEKVKDLEETSPINYAKGLDKAKVLLIYGEKDEIVPKKHGEVMCGILSNCRLEIVKGMKHSPMGSQIGEISRILENFFKPDTTEN